MVSMFGSAQRRIAGASRQRLLALGCRSPYGHPVSPLGFLAGALIGSGAAPQSVSRALMRCCSTEDDTWTDRQEAEKLAQPAGLRILPQLRPSRALFFLARKSTKAASRLHKQGGCARGISSRTSALLALVQAPSDFHAGEGQGDRYRVALFRSRLIRVCEKRSVSKGVFS